MEAYVKESKRHAEESKKKTKVAEWILQDATRRVKAVNWQNTILKKKVKSVKKELTKSGHDCRFAKGRRKRLSEPQGGNDPRYEIVKAKGEAVGEQNCTLNQQRQFKLDKEEMGLLLFYEETKISHYQSLAEQHCKPLETHIIVDGTRSRE